LSIGIDKNDFVIDQNSFHNRHASSGSNIHMMWMSNIELTTLFVERSTTETSSESALVTKISLSCGLKASPTGCEPTGMVATTVWLSEFITDTVSESALATNTGVCGRIATPVGTWPTGMYYRLILKHLLFPLFLTHCIL
jgi:hypothetical protein